MSDQVCVARERELAQLAAYLQEAVAGRDTVLFVTGEAGAGKTTLVTEFARRAQNADEELLVAHGSCNAQTGLSDPYLPFREILAMFVGDWEKQLAQGTISQKNANRLQALFRYSGEALIDLGPLLINTLVPGTLLATNAVKFVAKQVGVLDKFKTLSNAKEPKTANDAHVKQEQIFEQYTDVLQALAARQPLILWLDDLHWVDPSSASLLFHLGRSLTGSRILIIGSYRSEEIALGRLDVASGERQQHPLQPVVAEFKRYRGDIELDLSQAMTAEGRAFVDALLDTEANVLSPAFRHALFEHTGGQPLFTTELLRDMQERGVLVQDDQGRWTEAASVDWDLLPARVEGVIETRVNRLEAELREALTTASVEGEQFTAEVVARLREVQARDLVRQLSGELDKKHQLVRAEGTERVGGQRLSLYRFRHNLIYKYLYNSLDEVERSYLHEDVGAILEELYWEDTAPVAVQLARHFEQAGLTDKAVVYLRQAGEAAAASYAFEEAVTHFSRALALVPEGAREKRYELLLAREQAYDDWGNRAEQAADLERLATLVGLQDKGVGAPVIWQVQVRLRQASYYHHVGDYPAAISVAEAGVALAEANGLEREAAALLSRWGHALLQLGQFAEAQERLEVGRVYAERTGAKRELGRIARALGIVFHHQADFKRTKELFEMSLALFRETGDRHRQIRSLNNLANVSRDLGEYGAAHEHYRAGLALAEETQYGAGKAFIINNLASLLFEEGNLVEARSLLEQALPLSRALNDRHNECYILGNLGELAMIQGDYGRAHDLLRESLALCREMGFQVGEAGALASLAQLALRQENLEEAEALFRQAAALHEALNQPHFLIGDQAGLAQVALRRRDTAEARERLTPVLVALAELPNLDGVGGLYSVMLICSQVLQATDEAAQARDILDMGYGRLQIRAEALASDAARDQFWSMPVYAELKALWSELSTVVSQGADHSLAM